MLETKPRVYIYALGKPSTHWAAGPSEPGSSLVGAIQVNKGGSGKVPVKEGGGGKGYATCPYFLLTLLWCFFLLCYFCHRFLSSHPLSPSSLKTLAPASNSFIAVNDFSSYNSWPSNASATCSLTSWPLTTQVSQAQVLSQSLLSLTTDPAPKLQFQNLLILHALYLTFSILLALTSLCSRSWTRKPQCFIQCALIIHLCLTMQS